MFVGCENSDNDVVTQTTNAVENVNSGGDSQGGDNNGGGGDHQQPDIEYRLTVDNASTYDLVVAINGDSAGIPSRDSHVWHTNGLVTLTVSGHPGFPGYTHSWVLVRNQTVLITDDEISN